MKGISYRWAKFISVLGEKGRELLFAGLGGSVDVLGKKFQFFLQAAADDGIVAVKAQLEGLAVVNLFADAAAMRPFNSPGVVGSGATSW